MQIILRSSVSKWTVILVEVALFVVLVVWLAKVYVAQRVAQKLTVANLQRAIKLDPRNADHHLLLGRIFQYNVAEINLDGAIEHLKRAAELNPHDPQPWLELGVALEFQGKTAEAETCLRRADFLAPHIPGFQWAIGNFFLLHDNVDEAFRHFKSVLAGSSQYNWVLFDTAWKASGDAKKILKELIPNGLPTQFDYLYYLLSRQLYLEAQDVWKRIAQGPENFSPTQAAGYIDILIGARRPDEAYQVWTDLRSKGLIRPTYEPTSQSLLLNGGFEDDLLNIGFDWRIAPLEGVYAGSDLTTFHSPGRALLIQFSGKQNLSYRHVYQFVRVRPRRFYRLSGFMKTAGITTDSGPRFEVRDAYNPSALRKASEGLTGSTVGWTPLAVDFVTGPETELLVVAVVRPPTRKLDNLLAGKVWIDDVSLTEEPGVGARTWE